MLSRNAKFNVRHNIFMALIKAEKSGMAKGELISPDTALMIHKDADVMTDMVSCEYSSKKGAGALWLNKQLKNDDWLDKLQEDSWKLQKTNKPIPCKVPKQTGR